MSEKAITSVFFFFAICTCVLPLFCTIYNWPNKKWYFIGALILASISIPLYVHLHPEYSIGFAIFECLTYEIYMLGINFFTCYFIFVLGLRLRSAQRGGVAECASLCGITGIIMASIHILIR